MATRSNQNNPEQKTKNGIKVLAAACLALNQVGEGSSPSDPTK